MGIAGWVLSILGVLVVGAFGSLWAMCWAAREWDEQMREREESWD